MLKTVPPGGPPLRTGEEPPAAGVKNRVGAWLEERVHISELAALAKKKTVPVHRHTVWYYFGGMALFLFFVQVLTGALLLLYFRPSAEEAFESVQFIMTEVRFGWLVRSIHSWSANLMIGIAFVHLCSVFFLKAYRKPRELTWVSGVLVFFLVLAFGFSGYLLPWNELAFFATKVGTEIAGVVPVIGGFIKRFLRGGEDVTGATLTRFFGWHVAILPALTVILSAIHLLLVQRLGMSVPLSVERKIEAGRKIKTMPFFPNFFLRDLVGWFVALGVLAALAALYPWELGRKADPFAPAPANIRPEWYFVFMFQTLKLTPAKILAIDGERLCVLAFGLGAIACLLVPFLDRRPAHGKSRLVFSLVGGLIILYMLVMTFWAYR